MRLLIVYLGAYYGPVHLNIGNNPNAMQTQSQEWERVYGSITCGMGDLSLYRGCRSGYSQLFYCSLGLDCIAT